MLFSTAPFGPGCPFYFDGTLSLGARSGPFRRCMQYFELRQYPPRIARVSRSGRSQRISECPILMHKVDVEGAKLLEQEPNGQPVPRVNARAEYVDLRTLFRGLWRLKWIILAVTVLAFLVGLRDLRGFESSFVAEMIVLPTQSGEPSFERSSQVPQILGLLGGVSGSNSPVDRLRILISSKVFADHMDEKYGLLHEVYEGAWDEQAQNWKKPTGWRFELREKISSALRRQGWTPPSTTSLSRYFASSIVIEPIGVTEFSRIRFAHSDADFAKTLLSNVVQSADDLMRGQNLDELVRNRAYILGKLASVRETDLRGVLYDMLRSTEGKIMLAEGAGPFAVEILQPAYVKDRKTEPDVLSTLALPTILAFLLSVALASLWTLFRLE